MKRLTAFFICTVLVLTLCACREDKDGSGQSHTVDVEYYAKIGQIPEHKYHLGSDAKEMQSAFDAEDDKNSEESEDGHTHSVYSIIEDDGYTVLSYEGANYCYKEDGKISAVVSLDSAYDFQLGDLISEIKSALSKFECEEKAGNAEDIFFLPNPTGYTCLEYKFGANKVLFVFYENALCATALINPEYF